MTVEVFNRWCEKSIYKNIYILLIIRCLYCNCIVVLILFCRLQNQKMYLSSVICQIMPGLYHDRYFSDAIFLLNNKRIVSSDKKGLFSDKWRLFEKASVKG